MDDDLGDTEQASQFSPPQPQDGSINFALYTLVQLRELQLIMDPARFPKNHEHLLAALAAKAATEPTGPERNNSIIGRFTKRSGLIGWLEAKVARSPLYGRGALDLRDGELVLSGWQRTWLGAAIESSLARDDQQVRNAQREGTVVRFELAGRYLLPQRIAFQCDDETDAQRLEAMLPRTRTAAFAKHWAEIIEFNRRLRELSGRAWVTPALVALNVGVYLTMALTVKRAGFTVQEMLDWGSNYGPQTVHGQWWRVVTALFLHFNMLHLGLNMWALWNIGRASERLYGSWTLLLLYLTTGLLASLSSIVWDPALSSAGASGAIFGVLGAYLAFLIKERRDIPATVFRKHWFSTAAFVLFNLINGAIQPGIDNAAHVGGLTAGFALGFLLARGLERDARVQFPTRQALAALMLTVLAVIGALMQATGAGSELNAPERFARMHPQFMTQQSQNLLLWNTLAQRASTGSISDAEFAQQFATGVLPFYEKYKESLNAETGKLVGPDLEYGKLAAGLVELRYQWASTLIDAAKNFDSAKLAEANKLKDKTLSMEADLERIAIRSRMDHRPRALASSRPVMKIRQWLTGQPGTCVEQPLVLKRVTVQIDNPADGPAMRHVEGCRAQQLFMAGEYATLEALMVQYQHALGDLPDGSSRYEGLNAGLDDAIRYGGLSVDAALGHTADWRRQVKDSTMADLVEAMIFQEWAWAERGSGSANTVTPQSFAIFSYRTEMSAVSLAEIAKRAADNPLWYTLSLNVALDQSKDKADLREIFDEGWSASADYRPVYRAMLRALMPRWGGSYDEVNRFIGEIQSKTWRTRGYEPYAELYSIYANLEGDELDLFADTPAVWSGMRSGYIGLLKRHPKSDVILNSFANFACRAGDKDTYSGLRGSLEKRTSSVSWTDKYSIQSCDRKFAITDIKQNLASLASPELPYNVISAEPIRVLGGVRLGMRSQELIAAKGQPIRKTGADWVYNTPDSSHDGTLVISFGPTGADSGGSVQAIEYIGDAFSAPSELPYMNEWKSVTVLQAFGPQISGQLTLFGEMTFKFKSGLFVDTHDEKVYRYGIFSTL
jgi:rhomboid protease GluP